MGFLENEILDLITVKQLLVIIHLLGLALGAGAALFSDFLFSSVMDDRKITKTEFAHLKLVSKVVWIGLAILFVSGALLFIGDSERLLDSSKFLAKMTILVILTINGFVFHFNQLPGLERLVGKKLTRDKKFMYVSSVPFFVGGAVSGTSWVAALVLGSLSSIDLSYSVIMAIYGIVVAFAAALAMIIRKRFLFTK